MELDIRTGSSAAAGGATGAGAGAAALERAALRSSLTDFCCGEEPAFWVRLCGLPFLLAFGLPFL